MMRCGRRNSFMYVAAMQLGFRFASSAISAVNLRLKSSLGNRSRTALRNAGSRSS